MSYYHMVVVDWVPEHIDKEYQIEGRQILKAYPRIYELLELAENQTIPCSLDISALLSKDATRIHYKERLERLERGLERFWSQLGRKDKTDIANRLADSRRNTSNVETELDWCEHLEKKFPGKIKWNISKKRRAPDIIINLPRRRVTLECHRLGENNDLIKCFCLASAKIGTSLKSDFLISLRVNTAKLIWTSQHLNIEASSNKIFSDYQRLAINSLLGHTKSFSFDIGNMTGTIRDNLERLHWSLRKSEADTIESLAKNSEINDFLNVDADDIRAACICSFIGGMARCKTVSIQDDKRAPSTVANEIKRLFTKKLIENTIKKLNADQIVDGAINILIVEGECWALFSILDQTPLEEIKRQLEEPLRSSNFSAIVLGVGELGKPEIIIDVKKGVDKEYIHSLLFE